MSGNHINLEAVRRLHFYLAQGMNIQEAMQWVLQDVEQLEQLFGEKENAR